MNCKTSLTSLDALLSNSSSYLNEGKENCILLLNGVCIPIVKYRMDFDSSMQIRGRKFALKISEVRDQCRNRIEFSFNPLLGSLIRAGDRKEIDRSMSMINRKSVMEQIQ